MRINEKNEITELTNSDVKFGVLKIPEGVEVIKADAVKNLSKVRKIYFPESLKSIGHCAFERLNELRSVVFKGKELDSLGNGAFRYCPKLKTIQLPKTISELGDYAFYACTSLESAEIPEIKKYMGESVFEECTGLKSVVLPENLEAIPKETFYRCTSLKNVKMPTNLTCIYEDTFHNCSSLKNIEVPDSVQKIYKRAFYGCSSLSDIKFSNNLKEIEEVAFAGCNSLKNVVIPDSVLEIGGKCFEDCANLESIQLSNGMRYILGSLFENCQNLKTVIIPESITSISSQAFKNCTNLENIKLPENLISISDRAFKNCFNLKNIVIPSNTSFLGECAFENCKSLDSVEILGNVKDLEGTFSNCTNLREIKLPNSVQIIGDNTFINCNNLQSLDMPEEVTTLGISAFENCKNLKNVNFSSKLNLIDDNCFKNCENLEKIILPKSLEQIGGFAFYDCKKIDDLYLGNNTRTVGEGAFIGCESLKKANCTNNYDLIERLNFGSAFDYLDKIDDGFVLFKDENLKTETSIDINHVLLSLPFLAKNWDYRNMLVKEERSTYVRDFYNTFIVDLPQEKVDEFLASHNFTFFKQLDFHNLGFDTISLYKGLYNLGALDKPMDINGKKVDYAQKVIGFLQEEDRKGKVHNLSSQFEKMKVNGFNKEFTDFYLKNFEELSDIDENNAGFISNCYNDFDEVQRTNTSNRGSQRQLKPTVEKFVNYYLENKFTGVTEKTKPISHTISPYYDIQQAFDEAVEIMDEKEEKGTPNNILSEHLSEKDAFANIDNFRNSINELKRQTLANLTNIASNEFSFEWLEKNDPQNLILGKLCSCCAHLTSAGFGIMHASIVHPDVQNLVIRNEKGRIVAKSTLYVNRKKGYGIFNNVEINDRVPKSDYEKIYEKYILGVKEFAERYNKENPDYPLTKLNVGMGFNDLRDLLRENNMKSNDLLIPINYSKYGKLYRNHSGDSYEQQYIVWEQMEKE